MTGTEHRTARPSRPARRPPRSARSRPTRFRRGGSRPTRRRALLRRWGALAVLLAICGLVYALLYTPLLGVRSVAVRGAESLTDAEIRAAAAVELGKPMLRLDVEAIRARVAALPRVSTVDVTRSWPSTVEVLVTERHPIGVAKRPEGVHLVDATGFDYAVVAQAPPNLPAIELGTIDPADPTTRAVVTVLGAIPAQLRERVVSITAQSPGSVNMTLVDGKTVRWGNALNNERKAAVLGALLTQPGKTYDVASPDLPTIS